MFFREKNPQKNIFIFIKLSSQISISKLESQQQSQSSKEKTFEINQQKNRNYLWHVIKSEKTELVFGAWIVKKETTQ